jgi:hypothetical protein
VDSRFSYSIAIAVIAATAAAISVHVTVAASQTQASGEAMKTPWGDPDLQGIWTEDFDTPFNAPPSMRAKSFLPRRSGQRLTTGDRRCSPDSGPSPTLLKATTWRSLRPSSAQGRVHRWSSIRPMDGFRRGPKQLVSPPLPIGSFSSRCYKRPKPARPRRRSAVAGHMIQHPRRDVRSFLLATTRAISGASIATTIRRTARSWIVA